MVSRRNRTKSKNKRVNPSLNLLAAAPAPLRLQLPAFKRVHITLVGCGGTGSHIASGLAALALELRDRSVRCDIDLIDFDRVEHKNVGRQLFATRDVGQHKSAILVERLMHAYGIPLGAMIGRIEEFDLTPQPDSLNIVIGAVDNPNARACIASEVKEAKGRLWWLNCGNENASGQVALGNVSEAKQMKGAVELGMLNQLPAPHVLYPDCIATRKAPKARRAASCAELTANGEQGLMVNRMVAAYALELLHCFLVRRELKWFALAFDLMWGNTKAFALDLPTLAGAIGLSEKDLQN